jgi:hypothetical protein
MSNPQDNKIDNPRLSPYAPAAIATITILAIVLMEWLSERRLERLRAMGIKEVRNRGKRNNEGGNEGEGGEGQGKKVN